MVVLENVVSVPLLFFILSLACEHKQPKGEESTSTPILAQTPDVSLELKKICRHSAENIPLHSTYESTDWKRVCRIFEKNKPRSFDVADLCVLDAEEGNLICDDSTLRALYGFAEHLRKEILSNTTRTREIDQEYAVRMKKAVRKCTVGSKEYMTCIAEQLQKQIFWLDSVYERVRGDTKTICKKEFLVALDTGHSVKRGGATSARGVKEYDFNKRLSEFLSTEIRLRGMQVHAINPKGQNMSLAQRTRAAVTKKADVFLSIHHDSAQEQFLKYWEVEGEKQRYSDMFKGYSLFVSGKSKRPKQSIKLAQNIAQQLQKQKWTHSPHHAEPIKGENRNLIFPKLGIYQWNGLGVLKRATMPAVLIEAGVIIHREEELKLQDSVQQSFMASSIAQGVAQYCLSQSAVQ